jgi:hypothetical protein
MTEAGVRQLDKGVKGMDPFRSAGGVEAVLARRLWVGRDRRRERHWADRPAHVN